MDYKNISIFKVNSVPLTVLKIQLIPNWLQIKGINDAIFNYQGQKANQN